VVLDMEKMVSLLFLPLKIKNGNILIRDSRVFWVKTVPIAYELIK
jgi:hypothetical protein